MMSVSNGLLREHLYPVEKHYESIDKKLLEIPKVGNWEGLKFPVNFSDINKF